jgi:hypothetical protein
MVRPGDAGATAAVPGPVVGAPAVIELRSPVLASDGPEVGRTGARFGGLARRRRRPQPVPAPVAEPGGPAAVTPVGPPLPGAEPEPEEIVAAAVTVRPYVLTGGRTRPRIELAVETLVSAAPRAAVRTEAAEYLAVVALCQQVRAVAEISALLRVPLGVVRVLVGDLEAMGAVIVHEARTAIPDVVFMERILSGLRRL